MCVADDGTSCARLGDRSDDAPGEGVPAAPAAAATGSRPGRRRPPEPDQAQRQLTVASGLNGGAADACHRPQAAAPGPGDAAALHALRGPAAPPQSPSTLRYFDNRIFLNVQVRVLTCVCCRSRTAEARLVAQQNEPQPCFQGGQGIPLAHVPPCATQG